MARPTKPAYDLTDAEKRDLIQLIQQSKPLPEKYRFILFKDKREVELVSVGVREEFEERWTGSYIFENEWQSFRTRKNRALELTSAPHKYTKPGR